MNTLYFSTTNQRKIQEANLACELFDIEVIPIALDFDEIQSHNPVNISKQKVEDAFRLAGKEAIVVADTSWTIPTLNGFPGGYMKDVAEWFESKDFLNLLQDKEDRTIIFTETIVYKDKNEVKVFSKEYKGVLADAPRGIKGNSIDKLAEFNGRTFAEGQDLGETSHKPEDFVWYEFAKWFSEKSKS